MSLTLLETVQLIMTGLTFIGIVIAVYTRIRKPDEDAAQQIAVMKKACELKHSGIDDDIHDIRKNHLDHIERDIRLMRDSQIKTETILGLLGNKFVGADKITEELNKLDQNK
jgi:hypothetical protein